jgi:hypothetical protein
MLKLDERDQWKIVLSVAQVRITLKSFGIPSALVRAEKRCFMNIELRKCQAWKLWEVLNLTFTFNAKLKKLFVAVLTVSRTSAFLSNSQLKIGQLFRAFLVLLFLYYCLELFYSGFHSWAMAVFLISPYPLGKFWTIKCSNALRDSVMISTVIIDIITNSPFADWLIRETHELRNTIWSDRSDLKSQRGVVYSPTSFTWTAVCLRNGKGFSIDLKAVVYTFKLAADHGTNWDSIRVWNLSAEWWEYFGWFEQRSMD